MKEPTDQLLYIADKYSTKMRNALLEAYRLFLESVSEEDILTALKYNGVQGLAELASQIGGDMANRVTPILTDAWQESGRAMLSLLPAGAVTGQVVFDSLPVWAVSSAEAHRARFVSEASETARQAVTEAVTANIIAGNNPRSTARDFRSAIGLTARQERAVWNYRNYLETLDMQALERDLRDHRSDSVVLRHIKNEQPLDEEYIDGLVERYRQRSLKWRSETIARVESMRAIHMGEYDSLYAAWSQGKLNPNLRRFWVAAMDERVRIAHRRIPLMNRQGVAVNEVFQTPLGPMRYPLDPEGVPENVINCRCTLIYRIVSGFTDYNRVPTERMLPRDISEQVGYASQRGLPRR